MTADLTRGACFGMADATYATDDVFYPGDEDSTVTGKRGKSDYTEAEAICARCPVRDLCLQDALAETVQWGYRAGMTPEQRQALKTRKVGRPVNKYAPTEADLEMRGALYTEGLNDREIAARLGVSDKTITVWRARNDLPANHPQRAHTPEQNVIKQRAYDAGCTDFEIAEQVGCKVGAIRKWRARLNLPVNPMRRERISA